MTAALPSALNSMGILSGRLPCQSRQADPIASDIKPRPLGHHRLLGLPVRRQKQRKRRRQDRSEPLVGFQV
jgi:hypothetical protein